jgi:diadenosine tetraphosphatase ApaH/serine/threonine PP2A family protein phosphatase
MRIGVFSDTHANIEALEVVLKALDEEGVDERVCLGDTVGYGASPNECCSLIRTRAAHTILGNHDAAVAGRMDYSYYYHAARHALDLHARLLTPENMQWLKNLPYQVRKGEVQYCHGSPLNIEEFDYIFARDQAAQCLEIWDDLAPLTLIGHSHLCKSFALSPDGVHEVVSDRFELRPGWKYIVSVGSVGQPRDYDPRASYVLFDTDKRLFEYRRVEYDVKTSAEKIFSTDLEPNFGHRLFIGV